MLEFVESPMWDNWIEENMPKESLIMVSPYIKKDPVLKLFENIGSKHIEMKVLIRGNKEEFTVSGSSDIEVLNMFLEYNKFDCDNFRRLQNLHMKAYLVDGKKILVTSGNMTIGGMWRNGNAEGGIATDEPAVINQFLDYFGRLWENAQNLTGFYDMMVDEYEQFIQDRVEQQKKDVKSFEGKYKERKVHVYHPKASETIDNPIEIRQSFLFQEVPRNSKIDHLVTTLEFINGHEDGLSYYDLGDLLRYSGKFIEIPVDEKPHNRKTNNNKFGEEKGKTCVYFALASTDYNNKRFRITDLGRRFLYADDDRRKLIIANQVARSSFFMSIDSILTNEEKVLLDSGDKAAKKRLYSIIDSLIYGTDQKTKNRVHNPFYEYYMLYYRLLVR